MSTAMEDRACRAAKRVGLMARKSRARLGTVDNRGGFMLLNEDNVVIGGARFDLTPDEVIEACKQMFGDMKPFTKSGSRGR